MIGRTNVGGGGSAAPNLQTKTITASGTYTPDTGYDGFSQVTASFDESTEVTRLRKLIDGSATSLVVPSNLTKVRAYLCWQSSSSTTLVSVDLGSVTTVEQYAFYQNRAIEILRQEVDGTYYFPRQVTVFGSYCFYYAGYNKRSSNIFVLHPTSSANVGTNAFYYGNVAKVYGTYSAIGTYAFYYANVNEINITCTGSIGDYAFQGCPVTSATVDCKGLNQYALNITNTTYTTLNLKIVGALGSYALAGGTKLENVTIDTTSDITSVGSYAFQGMGAQRSGTGRITIDLRNSSFTTLGQYAFYPSSTSYPLKNMDIWLPNKLATVSSNAFQYLKDSIIHFTGKAPTLSASSALANMSNTYVAVPIAYINDYKTKANFTGYTSIIRGEVTGRTSLPAINSEGYELTWYHDVACTTAVTSGDTISASTTYYCTAGDTKVAYAVKWTALNCTVVVSDGTNTYGNGDGVRIGTTITISATGDQGTPTPYIFTANGSNISSGDTVTIADADVDITAIYWDEVNPPANPTFSANTWQMVVIGAGIEGFAAANWHVGDTKEDSNGNLWRIVDLKPGRYTKVGGGKTNIVLEKVNLYGTNTTWYTSSTSEHYGQSALFSKMQSGGSYFSTEDQALAALADANKIIVKASQASSSTTVDVQCGFFAASCTEMGFADYGNATSLETVNDGTTFGAFQYYDGAANSVRVKTQNGSAYYYWLRSRRNSSSAIYVGSGGSRNSNSVSNDCGACPCVAF